MKQMILAVAAFASAVSLADNPTIYTTWPSTGDLKPSTPKDFSWTDADGNPQAAELAIWGGYDVEVNDGYKFGEGLLTVRGEVSAAVGVTAKGGFVIVTAKKSA